MKYEPFQITLKNLPTTPLLGILYPDHKYKMSQYPWGTESDLLKDPSIHSKSWYQFLTSGAAEVMAVRLEGEIWMADALPSPRLSCSQQQWICTAAARFSQDGTENAQQLQLYDSVPKQGLYSSLTTQPEKFSLNEQRIKTGFLEIPITSVVIL